MKIVSSGKVLHSSKFHKKKRRKKIIILILLFLGFFLVIYSLIYFSREKQFLVSGVSVLGENVIDREEIGEVAEQLLGGYYLWVIPRANFILYPRRTIEHTLVTEFPRLKSVSLDLSEMTLFITLEERLPFALYCADALNPTNASKCYFIDDEGLIFAPAPAFSGVTYFVYATTNPLENPIGERLVTVEEFKVLSSFMKNLETLNIRATALELGETNYNLLMPSGGKIIWQKDDDLSVIYSNLEAFLANKTIKAQKNFLERILYLDLSTKNKIRWNFKE